MTQFARHAGFHMDTLALGREGRPLLVIDNCLGQADELVDSAINKVYGNPATYYPGVRAKVPLAYQQFVLEELGGVIAEIFRPPNQLRFTSCHFSLVTTPPDKLEYMQRIPHVDSLNNHELAFVHYLFKRDLGGTAFYRHRQTGFEYIDQDRLADYNRYMNSEAAGPHSPAPAYIRGDTPLYEQIGQQDGVFNRLILYRRTSLHSGVINPGFVPDANPKTGRLSVTGFLA